MKFAFLAAKSGFNRLSGNFVTHTHDGHSFLSHPVIRLCMRGVNYEAYAGQDSFRACVPEMRLAENIQFR